VRRVNGATEVYQESLWPPVAALRETALLLVGLLLVALLVDGDLALLLAGVLILAWALLSFRGGPDSVLSVPLWFRLVPLFVAIVIADLIADEHWYPFTLVAVAAPLFVLARVGLVLQRRQRHATP
jgi:hypothetical protein